MKIYLAGPMRGLPGLNFQAFDHAAERWRKAGWQVMNPAAVDRAHGYSEAHNAGPQALHHVITVDLLAITHCDAIALLPGWQRSFGATSEVALAQFLGLPIYDAVSMDTMLVLPLPWGSRGILYDPDQERDGYSACVEHALRRSDNTPKEPEPCT